MGNGLGAFFWEGKPKQKNLKVVNEETALCVGATFSGGIGGRESVQGKKSGKKKRKD